ncbi:MAG: SDR family oxidoreductase [Pseudomonadota bacterium]|nr:SDR family oxidoreductase [Pseudomonadota bacterium]
MARRLHNKVALVTGAGSVASGWGNGKATAVVFAREGAKVFAADINFDAAEETCGIIADEGGMAVPFHTDVTKSDSVAVMVAACLDKFERIDILHNNVGGSVPGGPVDMPEEVFDQQIEFNLKSVFLTCKHVIPVMERQGSGAIINVASLAAIRHTGHYHSAYEAAKAGLLHYTRTMAVEYAPKGIRANTVIPGHVLTPLVEHRLAKQYRGGNLQNLIEERSKGIPMGHMGDAWDVAYAALYLASDEAKNTTGIHITVDGGVSVKCE